jgi:hypothetical protein
VDLRNIAIRRVMVAGRWQGSGAAGFDPPYFYPLRAAWRV